MTIKFYPKLSVAILALNKSKIKQQKPLHSNVKL